MNLQGPDSINHSQFFNIDIINILEIKIMERSRISYTIRRMPWAKIFSLMDRGMNLGHNCNVQFKYMRRHPEVLETLAKSLRFLGFFLRVRVVLQKSLSVEQNLSQSV